MAGAALATNNSSNVTLSNSIIHDTDFEAAYIFGDGSPVKDVSGTTVNVLEQHDHERASASAAASMGVQPDGIVISRAIGGTVSGNTLNGIDRDFLKLESVQNFIVSNNTATTGRIGYPAMQISPMYARHDLPSVNIRVTGNRFTGPGWGGGIQVNSDDSLTQVAKDIEVDHNTIVAAGSMANGMIFDGNAGLYNINIHDNDINSTTNLALNGYEGGGTGLILNNNRHNGTTMPNVSMPGAFPAHTQFYN